MQEMNKNIGGKHFSDYTKERIRRFFYNHHLSAKEISVRLWKEDDTIASWKGIRKFIIRTQVLGHSQKRYRRKTGPKFAKDAFETLSALVEKNPEVSALVLQEVLAKKGTYASICTINRARRFCGFDPTKIKYCQVKLLIVTRFNNVGKMGKIINSEILS